MKLIRAGWAILVGVKDVLVLAFLLLFFELLYAILSWSPNSSGVTEGALLLKLDGTIVEQPAAPDPIPSLFGLERVATEHRLRDVTTALTRASTDDRIKVVVLDLDRFLGGGSVALTAVGEALDQVRRAGKPVLTYATAYTDGSYQLAAHGTELWLDPMGGALFAGRGGSALFYKGLLDRLGVNVHVYKVGNYKSAPEPYVRTAFSDAARDENRQLADTLFARWQEDVKTARPRFDVAAYAADPVAVAERGPTLAQAALSLGAVDRLGGRRRFEARVAELAGSAPADADLPYRATSLADYASEADPVADGGVAVVTVAGTIVDGTGGAGSAAGDTVAQTIERAVERDATKALVVRIDSPGGSVLASERIRQAVLLAKAKKLPVVVSMGNVAASGGYWVATAGDAIFAEPATITGSIGVFGVLPTFEGTLAKLGLTTDGVSTTPLTGEPNVLGGTSAAFDRISQAGVRDIYRQFLSLVAKSRRLTIARVDSVAQGRVWDGGSARQLGLVDRFGGLDQAVAEAARRASLKGTAARATFVEPEQTGLARLLGAGFGEGAEAGMPPDWFGRQAWLRQEWTKAALLDAATLAGGGGVRAQCLTCGGFSAPSATRRASSNLLPLLGKLAS